MKRPQNVLCRAFQWQDEEGDSRNRGMPLTKAMTEAIPLVDAAEWERYITLPRQVPAPTTTAGRVEWWKGRVGEFPLLAPVAIAYLLTPRSSAQAERTFSLLGHMGTCTCGYGGVFVGCMAGGGDCVAQGILRPCNFQSEHCICLFGMI